MRQWQDQLKLSDREVFSGGRGFDNEQDRTWDCATGDSCDSIDQKGSQKICKKKIQIGKFQEVTCVQKIIQLE
jgi:hypothetical protein